MRVGAVLLLGLVLCSCGEEHAGSGTSGPGAADAGAGAPPPPPGLEEGSLEAGPDTPPDLPPGRWRRAPAAVVEDGLTPEQRRQLEELEAIGYADGVQEGTGRTGVTRHDRERVADGLNLYLSAHATEAYLIDMDGHELHRWSISFEDEFPGRTDVDPRQANQYYWRRAVFDDQGHLFALHDGLGMVKIDRESNLVWSLDAPVHHDLELLPDGSVLTLTRHARLVPRWGGDRPLLLEHVATVSADGQVVREMPLLETFQHSPFRDLFAQQVAKHHALARQWERDGQGVTRPWGDVFHGNTLERLDGRLAHRSPVFSEGNLLVSLRNLDLLAIVDPRAGRVVWARTGRWAQQHQPSLLDDGSMLVFSNLDRPGRSAVVQFDPLTGEELWVHSPDDASAFFSSALGSCQRLPDGHTLITESHAGRAFEITPDGEVVWEFHSPHRAGPQGRFVANLLEVVRVPRSAVEPWLR